MCCPGALSRSEARTPDDIHVDQRAIGVFLPKHQPDVGRCIDPERQHFSIARRRSNTGKLLGIRRQYRNAARLQALA